MHFLETDAGQRGVFEHVTSILRGTRTHPRIETFVMAIFGMKLIGQCVLYKDGAGRMVGSPIH